MVFFEPGWSMVLSDQQHTLRMAHSKLLVQVAGHNLCHWVCYVDNIHNEICQLESVRLCCSIDCIFACTIFYFLGDQSLDGTIKWLGVTMLLVALFFNCLEYLLAYQTKNFQKNLKVPGFWIWNFLKAPAPLFFLLLFPPEVV